MEIFNNILFWLHLVSLAVGGAASFGIPVVGGLMPTVAPEVRPTLFKVIKGLSTVGRGGLAGLIVTGPLLVWLKFGGVSGFTGWFWAKMVFVVILIGLIAWAGVNARRAEGGDMDAVKRAPMIGGLATLVLLAVIFTAVFEFG